MSKRVLHAPVNFSADTLCGRHTPVHGGLMASSIAAWLTNDADHNKKHRCCKRCIKAWWKMKDANAKQHH